MKLTKSILLLPILLLSSCNQAIKRTPLGWCIYYLIGEHNAIVSTNEATIVSDEKLEKNHRKEAYVIGVTQYHTITEYFATIEYETNTWQRMSFICGANSMGITEEQIIDFDFIVKY